MLSDSDRKKLLEYINVVYNPFNVPVKIHIIDKNLNENGEKLGTYGTIKGAKTFLGLSVPNTDMALVAAGYQFENLILYATNMGLGTVWLAATFSRDDFSKAMQIDKNDLFIAISPVEYPTEKRRIAENIMRTAMKSSSRKS